MNFLVKTMKVWLLNALVFCCIANQHAEITHRYSKISNMSAHSNDEGTFLQAKVYIFDQFYFMKLYWQTDSVLQLAS